MNIFQYQDVEAEDAGEGTSGLRVRWLITREMGAQNFAMRIFEMEPGGFSPFHSHSWEHEVFVLKGEGMVVSEGEEKRFRAGDVIFIPPDEKHQFKNSSRKTVQFICLVPYKDE